MRRRLRRQEGRAVAGERGSGDGLRVDVVVPVYGNLPAVSRCLRSVIASSAHALGRIIVVDDASPDSETIDYLNSLKRAGSIDLIRHSTNTGVVGAENSGVAASERDVVLLNSDTEVHGDWLDRLARCAYSAADIGTATPFSNEGSICTYPHPTWWREMPGGFTVGMLDDLFARVNAGQVADIPSGVSFCMLIRRTCIDQVGPFDVANFGRGYGDETDFCQRAAKRGWRNVVCGDTFVYHEGGGSFGPERIERAASADRTLEGLHPGYGRRVREFMLSDSLRSLRAAVDAARAEISVEQALAVLEERADEKRWLLEWLSHSLRAQDS